MSGHCHVESVQKIPTTKELETRQRVYLGVYGMGCVNCAARVRNGLLSVYGVTEALVDHTTGTADVVFNPNLTNVQQLG